MGVSDLVIGGFTSSAVNESIAGGTKTIYYLPSERYDKDIFKMNAFKHYSCRNYEELKANSDYWLNEATEEDFLKFQSTFIKGYIDSYCDGRAAVRLRSFIEEYNRSA